MYETLWGGAERGEGGEEKEKGGNGYFVGQSPTLCLVFCLFRHLLLFVLFSKGVSLALDGMGQKSLTEIHLFLPPKCWN